MFFFNELKIFKVNGFISYLDHLHVTGYLPCVVFVLFHCCKLILQSATYMTFGIIDLKKKSVLVFLFIKPTFPHQMAVM